MRAAVFRGQAAIDLEDVERPACGSADIVVEVAACGICGSDLHAYEHGRYVKPGQVMGHEFAGTVGQVGKDVAHIVVGDRVTVMPYISCGRCLACRLGDAHLCRGVTSASIAYGLPGAFAEQVRVPDAVLAANVHKLADHVSMETAALCEPLAVAMRAVRVAALRDRARAVVLGLGPIGLLVVRALGLRGAERILAVDVSEHRLHAARGLGASAVARAGQDALKTSAREHLGHVDVVFECSGVPALIDQALRLLRPGGTVVAVAIYPRPVEISPSLVVQRELQLKGSFAATADDFADSVRAVNDGALNADDVVSHRFPLTDIARAFETQVDRSKTLKVMIAGAV